MTRKELQRATDAPGYLIEYLYSCGRLPVVQESTGAPRPRLYHPDAEAVIKQHMQRNSIQQNTAASVDAA